MPVRSLPDKARIMLTFTEQYFGSAWIGFQTCSVDERQRQAPLMANKTASPFIAVPFLLTLVSSE